MIKCYDFGKALEDKYDNYKKKKKLGNSFLAQKIYDLFSEIGENRIKRVKPFTALSISKLFYTYLLRHNSRDVVTSGHILCNKF